MKIFKSNKHIYFVLNYKDVSITMCNQVKNTKEIDYMIYILKNHFNSHVIDAKFQIEQWAVKYICQPEVGLMICRFTDKKPSGIFFYNKESIYAKDFDDEGVLEVTLNNLKNKTKK